MTSQYQLSGRVPRSNYDHYGLSFFLPIGAVPGSHNKNFIIEGFLRMERQYVKYVEHVIGFVFCPFICPEVDYAIFKSELHVFGRLLYNNWIIHQQSCQEKYINFQETQISPGAIIDTTIVNRWYKKNEKSPKCVKHSKKNWKNLISNKYVREYTKLTISVSDTSDNKTIQTKRPTQQPTQPTQQKKHITEGQPLSAITTTATTTTGTGTTTKSCYDYGYYINRKL
ncbi:hypothetical protein INT45_008025 [Circinella minor]|uniref:Uncharacterized protein n=1 Tax=Circinella minor TaxID=1195481 RepID=A0A8H7VQA8_9FUNG|nr:hypothetical protein INT45_008025 [Circinella minor]